MKLTDRESTNSVVKQIIFHVLPPLPFRECTYCYNLCIVFYKIPNMQRSYFSTIVAKNQALCSLFRKLKSICIYSIFLLLFQENMHYDFISYTHQKRELPLFWINRFIHLFQQSRLGYPLALLVNLQEVSLH